MVRKNVLSTPFRKDREKVWIKELGTAIPYGCNDNVKGVGNLSSPACSDLTVMSSLNTTLRIQRSHGQKRYHRPNVKKSSKSRSPSGSFNDLLSHLHHPLGLHYNRTILFSLPVNFLKCLRDYAHDKGGTNTFSPIYRLLSIICDVALFCLFKSVRSEPLHDTTNCSESELTSFCARPVKSSTYFTRLVSTLSRLYLTVLKCTRLGLDFT